MMQQRGIVPAPRRPIAGSLPQQATPKTIQDLIVTNAATLAAILPKSLTPERFARIALTSIERNPRLRECTPQSLFSCILQAATVGLEVDNALGHAYLVPFRDKERGMVCQLILGYKGLVTLMHRAGKVSTVEAHIVREGDEFDYEFGLTPRLVHRPVPDNEGPVTHAYAIVRFRDGGCQFEIMTRREVETIRARSRAAHAGPWVTDWEEMAKKCPLRRISKLVPMSAEEARTVASDEMADAGLAQTFDAPSLPAEVDQLPEPGEEAQHTGAPAPVTSSPLTPDAPPIPAMQTLGDLLTWARDTHGQDSRGVLSALVMAGLRRPDGAVAKSVTDLVAPTPDAVQAAYSLLLTAWGVGRKEAKP